MDPAFKGAGQRAGTEIWRIVDFQAVPLAKSEYGKFYSGDSYIVLQTRSRRGGTNSYDIHFWIGTETSKDEAGTAAIKTIELDANLGGRAVQHRELQGHESDKFLSYFKPCIIPLEGGVASGLKNPEEEKFKTRLYACTGKRVAKLKQVPFSISSLNHDDVFILDTQNTIYQFNGAKSNIQERAKALEVIHFFKECYHEGKCDFIIVEDGKLQPQSELGDFWDMFGGFAPIGNKEEDEEDILPKTVPGTLYSITNGQLKTVEGRLSKPMLESRKCYILDSGVEVFVWVGRLTQVEDRKTSSQAAEKYISSQNKPKSTRLTQIMQGNETRMFKASFNSWPSGSGTSNAEDGVGKVTALLQQKGLGVQGKSTTKAALVTEEVPPLLERGGKVEVWRINDSAKTLVPKEDIGKFYSGDCYIVLYTCHSDTRKEDYFLCNWIGNDSLEDDQKVAARLAHAMLTTLKGRPTQGRIFQGKESPQFIAIFQILVILKGGLSSSYKNVIADKGLADETYDANNVALIKISGTSIHNTKGIQVDAAATSLNSHECFLLQSGSSIFIWHGNQSTFKQQQFSTKVAEFLRPGVALKHINEGTESLSFFSALGGKQIYTSKQAEEIVREPHLFTVLFNKEKFEVEEVHNFSQDDLLTEDIMILDTHAEVFVWVGRSVSSIEKQRAFEVGQNYINVTVSVEGLAPNIPLYKITEGHEPCFFTAYFSWDSTKASLQGNSFQKKVLLLFSENEALVNQVKSNEANLGGTTQRASALAALTAALNPSSDRTEPKGSPRPAFPSPSSQRAAAVAALSSVLKAEKKHDASPTQSPSNLSSRQDTGPFENSEGISDDKEQEERVSVTESSGETKEDKTPGVNEIESTEFTFTYDQLKTTSDTPATGIDFQKREAYLSDEEFEKILGMAKNEFYKMPKWKQGMTKKKNDLF